MNNLAEMQGMTSVLNLYESHAIDIIQTIKVCVYCT